MFIPAVLTRAARKMYCRKYKFIVFYALIQFLGTTVKGDEEEGVVTSSGNETIQESPLNPSEFSNQTLKMFQEGQLNGLLDILKPETLSNAGDTLSQFENAVIGPKVRFYLFNDPWFPIGSKELQTGNMTAVKASRYDPSKPVKILIHPWLGVPTMIPGLFPFSAKNMYLLRHRDKYNVIVLDYTRTTGYPIYPVAVIIGFKEVISNSVEFLKWLHDEGMIQLNQTHLIGLSLGAHIAGGIADAVKKVLGVPVGRVTGLDPIAIMFYPRLPFIRPPHVLSPNDAAYVDVGHTNAFIAGLGISKDVAQTDFHLNGGIWQPGCEELEKIDAVLATHGVPPGTGYALKTVCSHLIAGEYYSFTVAINRNTTSCGCRLPMPAISGPICCHERVNFGENSEPGWRKKLYMPFNPISATIL